MTRVLSNQHRHLNRRSLLQGAFGISLALPWLEVFQRTAEPQQTDPLRLMIFIHPNGVHAPEWFPDTVGSDYEIKFSLEPLAAFKSRMLMIGGVDAQSAMGHRGSGHTLGGAHLLTGKGHQGMGGKNVGFADSISFDQELANHIGKDSAIKSLHTGVMSFEAAGGDMPRVRYSYSEPFMPVTPEHRPKLVFDQLAGFVQPGGGAADSATADRLRAERASVLDFVEKDLLKTQAAVGTADRARLEEYVTNLRDLEKSVATQMGVMCEAQVAPTELDFTKDANIPLLSSQLLKLTQAAMQCDMTRVSTFQVSGEQSYVQYGDIDDPMVKGMGQGHHGTSHRGGHDIARICQFHSKLLAEFATGLDSVAEGTGTMLDNTIILYTNAIENGNRHNFDNLPHVVLGGTKKLNTGRFNRYESRTNNDLFLALLQAFGVDTPTFGGPEHVNGPLTDILV